MHTTRPLLTSWTKRLATLCVVFALSAAPSVGFANSKQKYTQQIQEFRDILTQSAKLDTESLAADDRSDAIRWLEEAELLLTRGDVDTAGVRLKRVEYAIDLISQMTLVSQIKGKVKEQESAVSTSAQQLQSMRAEVKKLQAQKVRLQRDLNTLNAQ